MIQLMMNLGIVPLALNNDVTSVWTMAGTIATAVATAGLVWMAWRAWRAALKTLASQQTNAEITALKDYMNALHALARLAYRTPPAFEPAAIGKDDYTRFLQNQSAYKPYVNAMVHDVEVAGSIWRAYHADSGQMGVEFRDAEQSLVEAQEWRLDSPKGEDDAQNEQYKLNAEFAKDLAGWANRWQVTSKDRSVISKVVDEECATFISTSPCCPKTV